MYSKFKDASLLTFFTSGVFALIALCSTLLHLPPLRFYCVEGCRMDWIELRTVATLALAVKRSYQLAKSHPRLG